MRTSKIFAIVATIVLACCFDAFANVVYEGEITNTWFHVDMSTLTPAALESPPWKSPENGEATVENQVIKLDTDVSDPLTYKAVDPSTNVAVVAVTMTATLNADYPEFTSVPQAALTTYCDTSETNWVGLVGNGEGGTQWVKFASPVPVVGRSYNVRIEFDQREGLPRQIRYLVDGTVLSAGDGGDGWYPNPQGTTADNIKNVSFSGSGDIAALDGENIIEVFSFVFNDPINAQGYDYTNGVISVSAGVLGYTDVKAILKVSGTGGQQEPVEMQSTGRGSWSWDMNGLAQGGVYTYTIEAQVGGETIATTAGTFTAAKWPDNEWPGSADSWFGANASLNEGSREWGGSWDPDAKPTVAGDADKYYKIDDALFKVADPDPGSNHVTRIDADVMFEILVDQTSLDAGEDGVLGGFVAATSGEGETQWMALTKNGDLRQWVELTGDIAPETNVQYVIRAEIDFISATKRVRYLVSSGEDDEVFHPLSAGGSQWIDLVAQGKDSLEAVELKGSGRVAKFVATVADRSLAEVNGTKYDTMDEALDAADTNGTVTITLRTNATVDPKKPGMYEIAADGHSYVAGGKSSFGDRTIVVDGTGKPLVRPSKATMTAVRTPANNPYKSVNALREFLENNQVDAYTSGDGDADEIGTALNASGLNGLPLWQDYVMGIDQTASVTPEYTPSADKEQDKFMMQVPALAAAIAAGKTSGDYAIQYRVDKDANPGKAQQMPETCFIPVELPNAAASYDVRILLEPTPEPELTPEPEPTPENE